MGLCQMLLGGKVLLQIQKAKSQVEGEPMVDCVDGDCDHGAIECDCPRGKQSRRRSVRLAAGQIYFCNRSCASHFDFVLLHVECRLLERLVS